jgi:drug/metabolite transporter (DMT)-like permease
MNKSAKGLLWSFFGVLILSPDTLLIRLLNLSDFSLIFYRSFLPAISIFLFIFWMYKKETLKVFLLIGLPGIIYAMFYAITHVCFVYSIQNTSVANTLVIIAGAPIFAALFLNNFSKGKTISIYLGNNFCRPD